MIPQGREGGVSLSVGGGWKHWAAPSPLTPLWGGDGERCLIAARLMWELRLSTGLHRHPLRGECTSILLLGEVGHPGSLGWGEVSLPWGGGRRPALHTASTVPTPVVNRGDWLFTSRSEWKCRPCLGLYRGDGDGEEYPVTCSPPVTLRLPLDLSWHHPVGRGRKPPCWARWNFWFPTRICSWGWRATLSCCCVWLEKKG